MNNLTILHHRSTSKTARLLSEVLDLEHTQVANPYTPVVIRWGSSAPASVDMAVNNREAIALTSHGLNSLVRLQECDVPTPTTWTSPPENQTMYPILARRINHRGGMDIIWCDDHEQAVESGRHFFTRFFPVHREYRVHVFGGSPLRAFRKVKREEEADLKIRTSYRGWGYSRVKVSNVKPRGIEVSLNAVTALGLTYGAVDLGYNEDTDKFVVFEVNTGPSLNSTSLLYYAQQFEHHLLHLEGVSYEPTGLRWSEEIDRKTASRGTK